MPSIGIIIPTYDRPALLERALLSCLSQSCSPDEIIIINNGDNPETREVSQRNLNFFDGFSLFLDTPLHKPRLAVAKGIEHLHSDWCIILDDDDFLLPERIEQDQEYLQKLEPSVVTLEHHFLRMNFDKKTVWMHQPKLQDLTLIQALKFESFGPLASATLKTEILKEHHPFHLPNGWFDFDCRCAILQHGTVNLNPSFGYVMDDTKTTTRETKNGISTVKNTLRHGVRYRHLIHNVLSQNSDLTEHIHKQASFFAGKNGPFLELPRGYRKLAFKNPTNYAQGKLSQLRYHLPSTLQYCLPPVRGSKQVSQKHFSKLHPRTNQNINRLLHSCKK